MQRAFGVFFISKVYPVACPRTRVEPVLRGAMTEGTGLPFRSTQLVAPTKVIAPRKSKVGHEEKRDNVAVQ
jgi:hypothetical protein